jgi:cation transport ATPase
MLREPPTPPSATASPAPSVEQLLARPDAERAREFKYRFAQSVVFGLPVLALHWLGPMLGGAEAPRWTGLLQALLAGWATYVAAAGMVFEGALLLARGRATFDLVVGCVAGVIYLLGVVGWGARLIRGEASTMPMPFHYLMIVLILWCGVRWAWWSRTGGYSGGSTGHQGSLI